MSEWGDPAGEILSAVYESIVCSGEPGELKHLSSRRKRKKHRFAKVAASEMARGQTAVRALQGSDRINDL